MDQFGILVESIGFKSQCKVPLADLKGKTSNNIINDGFPGNIGAINSGSLNPSFDDGLDGIFKSNSDRKKTQNSSVSSNDFDDVFGEFVSSDSNSKRNPTVSNGTTMFDFDSVFNGGPSNSNLDNDDIFGGMPGFKTSGSSSVSTLFKGSSTNLGSNSTVDNDDIFGPMPGFKTSGSSYVSSVIKGSSTNLGSNSTVDNDDIFGAMPGLKASRSTSVSTDDLFGSMVPPPSRSNSIDDLLGDFGGMKVNLNVPKSNSGKKDGIGSATDDLIPGFGGTSRSSNGAKSATIPPPKSSRTLTEDPFVMFERSNDNSDGVSGAPGFDSYLDSFFKQDTQTTRGGKTPKTEDSVFDTLFQKAEPPKKEQKQTSSGVSYTKKKSSSVTNSADDFSFLFEVEVGPSSEFQEIQGESEERRKARLNHHMRTQQRMAKVLNEKTQRDLQTQREQEERHRLAETLDVDIKRWAAGKEGNLRALLSSLQQVLWPECGWQPVSLTDLITSNSVKKVYYKATLCVHPDKVQQKGATLEQKYIAEKVFDLLKEAWNKLNTEELKKR